MKKQALKLLIIFSNICLGSGAQATSSTAHELPQKPPTFDTQSEKQTQLLEKQNEILMTLLQIQYNTALQAEQENEHKKNRAMQASKQWINKESILKAVKQKSDKSNNDYLSPHKNMFDNEVDIFFKRPDVIEIMIDGLECGIDRFDRYLWPTIRSIIINKIATKIVFVASETIDNICDDTLGVRPAEFLSSLTPEQRQKNQLLRTPAIAALMTQRDALQATLAPDETTAHLSSEIHKLTILLAQAKDPHHINLLKEFHELQKQVEPASQKEKLEIEVAKLKVRASDLRNQHATAAAQSGTLKKPRSDNNDESEVN